ncbi:MAG: stage II sporulation protein R [Clostridia bacterium]|nr:stage II sporulation protein R [Clostridia bacterium]
MKKISAIFLVLTVTFSYAVVYAQGVNEILSSELLRFHIISSSESEEDNRIKLDVRDYISERMTDCDISPYTQEYVMECERLANIRLLELGVEYKAKGRIERVYIPKKSYKGISLPSGYYNAIRLVLGNGEGQNWWCVAYPSLCFSEDVNGELSKRGTQKLIDSVPENIYELISDDAEYRFFIVDLIGRIIGKTSR